jgi:phage recombination protein Bet
MNTEQTKTEVNPLPVDGSLPVNGDKGKIVYQVAGQDVSLSYQIVRDFLTKGNGKVSNQDLTQFICICKYNQLNPFLGEAYLIKFGDSPAQMIVSKEAFLKRADACEQYEGIQAGIIVIRGEEAVELEGCFHLPGDKLAGGWAKVYRKDKKFPTVAKVLLEEYNKKQSIWNDKQSTMISKVAKVQALREAFPSQLGAMYTQEESNVIDVEYVPVDNKSSITRLRELEESSSTPPQGNVSTTTAKKSLL